MESNKRTEVEDLKERLFNLTREYETICNSYEQMCEIHRQEMARMQLIVDHHKEVVQDIILTLAHGKVE